MSFQASVVLNRPTLWPFARQSKPHQQAVIDIGSNSVRLIVYQVTGRSIVPRINEKVMAGLGSDLVETGRLSEAGVESSLKALARYMAICASLGIDDVRAIATAATRDAEDGPEFCRRVEETCGIKVQVLTGAEEARFAALGVVAAERDPTGLIGDLGGSSLELVSTDEGVLQTGRTYKLGPLALRRFEDGAEGDLERHINAVLDEQGDLPKAEQFYAVGGAWRAFASLHMELNNYPLRVLQSYVIPSGSAIELCNLLNDKKNRPTDLIKSVAGKRAATLHLTALTLKAILERSGATEMHTSAYGLREGIVLDAMDDDTRKLDPLLAGLTILARPDQRQAAFSRALQSFLGDVMSVLPPVFGEDDQLEQRLHTAACIVADLGATMHPDHRADIVKEIVLRGPYTGIDHIGRIYLGLLSAVRYYRKFKVGELEASLLTPEQIDRAKTIALLIRVAAEFSGRTERILKRAKLTVRGNDLILSVPPKYRDLVSEGVIKRLGHAASHMELTPQIEV